MEEQNSSQYGGAEGSGGNGANNGAAPPVPALPPDKSKDGDGNEISILGKFLAGLLLIGLTVFSALYLIGHWPDRLPAPYETLKPLYTYEWFNVRLAGIVDSGRIRSQAAFPIAEKSGALDTSQRNRGTDTTRTANRRVDTARPERTTTASGQVVVYKPTTIAEKDLVHINTILLILVATGGFIGNMIHVATSFTTFIGNRQYKRSWGLWYVVKPFTAAALAVAIYFVFRGGFLNMSDDSTNINLYGLMTVSILAGLFTDRTTIKLKEVFEVLLRPSEDRANPLTEANPQITRITGEPLEIGKATTITLTGKNLDKQTIIVKIEGQAVNGVNRQPTSVTFNYTLPPEMKNKDSLKLEVLNDKGEEVYPATQLAIKSGTNRNGASNATTGTPASTTTQEQDEEYMNQDEFGDPDTNDDINRPQE